MSDELLNVVDDAYDLPFLLMECNVPDSLLVHDGDVIDAYCDKAEKVWGEAITLLGGNPNPTDARLTTAAILAVRIFSPNIELREADWRAAFAACWLPEYQETIMAAGDSVFIWNKEHADYRYRAKQGDVVADAIAHMMDVLKQEGGAIRMVMAGDEPAMLWDDLLRAADARTDAVADALLVELIEEKFATWTGDKAYVLFNSLIWSAPKVVMRLSRTPREKAAITKAGTRIFSAILATQPEAWTKLGELIQGAVERDGLGVLQQAETEARALGMVESGEPALVVSEDEDGAVKVERVRRPVN